MPIKSNRTRSQQVGACKARIYDYIKIQVRKDGGHGFTVQELRDAAGLAGESLNGFVLQAIRERLDQLR